MPPSDFLFAAISLRFQARVHVFRSLNPTGVALRQALFVAILLQLVELQVVSSVAPRRAPFLSVVCYLLVRAALAQTVSSQIQLEHELH